MSIDPTEVKTWITEELASSRSLAKSMTTLIDRCAAAHPHPDWSKLKGLSYGDIGRVEKWLTDVFLRDPPPSSVRGLWFGIAPVLRNGPIPLMDLSLRGSDRFVPGEQDKSWVAEESWSPNQRQANSSLLAKTQALASPTKKRGKKEPKVLGEAAEFPLCLGFSALAVRSILAGLSPSLILGAADSVGVAVGFDDGDFIWLGEIGPHGFNT